MKRWDFWLGNSEVTVSRELGIMNKVELPLRVTNLLWTHTSVLSSYKDFTSYTKAWEA